MQISIVIPSYNSQDTISDTLKYLDEQETAVDYEILLIDCSEHDKVKKVADKFDKVKYFHIEKRFNPGEGRNIGAKQAKGDILIFIDADVKLAKHSLQSVWEEFQSGKYIFGGALELNTDANSDLAAYLEHFFFNHESQPGRPACERNNLSSALMCFKRELFIETGGFKDIPRMQDTELTERLKKQGHVLYFCPKVLGFQTQNSSLLKVLRKIYINGQNIYYIRYQSNISKPKKLAFFFLLPLITCFKISRIIARHIRYQSLKNKLISLIIALPLIFSSFYWMVGFYSALIREQGIGQTR